MTALYSINLRVMGKSNIPSLNDAGLGAWAERFGAPLVRRSK